jgi:large subunit ribosomal protein L19
MSKSAVIQKLEEGSLIKRPNFKVGDTVNVHTRIIEGSKERVQVFQGTVIAKKGSGLSATFTVHRVAYGEGMERVFMVHSPRISKIEILRRGRVRRAKLNYIRGKKGKKAKVKGDLAAFYKDARENAEELAKEEQAKREAAAQPPAEEVVSAKTEEQDATSQSES